MPFRDAHRITGNVVKYCIEAGKTMKDLTLIELKGFSEFIESDLFGSLTLQASIRTGNLTAEHQKRWSLRGLKRAKAGSRNEETGYGN